MERHQVFGDDQHKTHRFLYNGRFVFITTERESAVDLALSAGRFYEHKMLGHITRTVKPGVFLDLGGNCGHHSVYFSLFCPSVRVYTFEPFPQHCEVILRNIKDNQLAGKMTLMPFAISSQSGVVRITTNSAVHESRASVPAMRLDDVISEKVTLVKIDVEGYECEVLKGAESLLRESRPALYVECVDEARLNDITTFLEAFEYKRHPEPFNASPTWFFHAS